MKLVQFGNTDSQVSALAYGAMSLVAERSDEGKAAVKRAFESGVNFYDVADVYGEPRGTSETILGEAIRDAGIPREEVFIASKCGIVFQGMVEQYTYKAYDLSARYIKESCENSLKRLGTDYIDLYQPHRIDYLTHPEETALALEQLKAEGKIRHVGVSNYSPEEIRALSAYTRIESLQTRFSLLHLEPLESGLMATCHEKRMSTLCYSPLHKAALTGRGKGVHSDWRAQREDGVVAQLRPFAERYGVSLGQLSLAWLMHLPGGVVPLVGTASAEHISEAVGACDIRISRDDWYEMLVIARGRPMPWQQPPYAYLKEQ